mgnify:CR=1 FL=1
MVVKTCWVSKFVFRAQILTHIKMFHEKGTKQYVLEVTNTWVSVAGEIARTRSSGILHQSSVGLPAMAVAMAMCVEY